MLIYKWKRKFPSLHNAAVTSINKSLFLVYSNKVRSFSIYARCWKVIICYNISWELFQKVWSFTLALANQMLGPDKKFFNVDYNKGIGRLYVYLHGCSQQVTV